MVICPVIVKKCNDCIGKSDMEFIYMRSYNRVDLRSIMFVRLSSEAFGHGLPAQLASPAFDSLPGGGQIFWYILDGRS